MTRKELSEQMRRIREQGSSYDYIAAFAHVCKSTAIRVCGGIDLVEKIDGLKKHKRRQYQKTYDCVDPVSMDVLRAANKCPPGCSAARWRMELSRRRMAADRMTGSDAVDAATIPNPLHGLGGWHR